MRRIGGAFERIIGIENLYGAWRDFRRGKRSRASVTRFSVEAERRLLQLHRALASRSYRPGPYRLHLIHEPKVRLVAAAPVCDRIVHHALYRQLAPALDRSLIDTSYACLPGRGTHRAVLGFLGAVRTHRYVLMLDIRHYFLSIDLGILNGILGRHLKEPRLLALCARVAESGRGIYDHPDVRAALGLEPGFPPPNAGLPIGNLTSQWWANHYLSGFDHFLKRELRVAHVQRYMDDITLFDDDRDTLSAAREQGRDWLWTQRRLRLKNPDAEVRSTDGVFEYLGYRISRRGIRPTRDAVLRAERRLSELARAGDQARVERSWASLMGWLKFGQQ